MLLALAKQLHHDFTSFAARQIRTREIVRVLSTTHIQELSSTPGEQWPQVKARQQQEIQAVRDGKFDVIDRRSWSYPYLPEALHRLNQPILKNTPYNLRRFSETPIPRRAINLIKNAILSLEWDIRPISDEDELNPEREKRIRITKSSLERPNNNDSFHSLLEAVLEDCIIGGFGCVEPRITPYYKRPFKLWSVDGSTIRLYADWSEGTPDKPRYAQMTGLKGEHGMVAFLDDELIYIRTNVRASTPFGLGMLEVAFNSVNAFLGVQDMAAKAGADQIHKTWLWWEAPQNPSHIQTVRRHIQNELEGQAKVSLMAGMKKPEIIEAQPVLEQDLLLNWQEFLIRIIAAAFDLSPLSLGLERDVNRNTGEIMTMSDFRGAVVPMARRIEEGITRHLLHRTMGWRDLEFAFIGLEDPDSMTKANIQKTQYGMNSLTPDEIREEMGRPPLPAGWGKLTQGQMMILQWSARGRGAQGAAGAGAGAGGGGGFGGGMYGGADVGDVFTAAEIAQMRPDEIQQYQDMGYLPQDTSMMKDQIQQQSPGLLEQMSEELQEFFDQMEKEEEKARIKPAPITTADEKHQLKKFRQSERDISVQENMIQNRGMISWRRLGTAKKQFPRDAEVERANMRSAPTGFDKKKKKRRP